MQALCLLFWRTPSCLPVFVFDYKHTKLKNSLNLRFKINTLLRFTLLPGEIPIREETEGTVMAKSMRVLLFFCIVLIFLRQNVQRKKIIHYLCREFGLESIKTSFDK